MLECRFRISMFVYNAGSLSCYHGVMFSLAFVRPQLEDAFALQLAEESCPISTIIYSTAVGLSLAAIARCCAAIAAVSLTPRLVVLTAVAFLSFAAHAWALNTVARRSKVKR